jgi:hypothetical protein
MGKLEIKSLLFSFLEDEFKINTNILKFLIDKKSGDKNYFYIKFIVKEDYGSFFQISDNKAMIYFNDKKIIIPIFDLKENLSEKIENTKVDIKEKELILNNEKFFISYIINDNNYKQILNKPIGDYNNGILSSIISSYLKKNGFDIKSKNYDSLKVLSEISEDIKLKIEK